jgi:hypothetical protein
MIHVFIEIAQVFPQVIDGDADDRRGRDGVRRGVFGIFGDRRSLKIGDALA